MQFIICNYTIIMLLKQNSYTKKSFPRLPDGEYHLKFHVAPMLRISNIYITFLTSKQPANPDTNEYLKLQYIKSLVVSFLSHCETEKC